MRPSYTSNGMQQYPVLGGAGGYVPGLFDFIEKRLDYLEGLFSRTGNTVKQYETKNDLPTEGSINTIYFVLNTGSVFYWDGEDYVSTGGTFELGTKSGQAYPGDRGLTLETKVTELDKRFPTSFTAAQEAAINSGITAALVADIDKDLSGYQTKLTSTQLEAVNSGVTSTTVSTVDELKDRVAALELGGGSGSGSGGDTSGIVTQINTLESKVSSIENTINNAAGVLGSGITSSDITEFKGYSDTLATQAGQINSLKTAESQNESEHTEFSKSIGSHETRIDDLETANKTTQQTLENLDTTIANKVTGMIGSTTGTLETRVSTLEANVGTKPLGANDVFNQLASINASITNGESTTNTLKEKVSSVESSIETVKGDMGTRASGAGDAFSRIGSLESSVSELNKSANNLSTDVESIKAGLMSATENLSEVI